VPVSRLERPVANRSHRSNPSVDQRAENLPRACEVRRASVGRRRRDCQVPRWIIFSRQHEHEPAPLFQSRWRPEMADRTGPGSYPLTPLCQAPSVSYHRPGRRRPRRRVGRCIVSTTGLPHMNPERNCRNSV
jgi:hypothetical protein